MNREPETRDENQQSRTNIDDEVAGVNLDDLDDLGAGVPVETSESASARLAEAVRSALQEDLPTVGQDIEVEVVDGVVRLHGRVAYLEDAEAAEAVSSQVPGVRYVQDDLDIEPMIDEG